MQISGTFTPRHAHVAASKQILRGVVGRKHAAKPLRYKREDDAANKAKDGIDNVKDSLKGWRRSGESAADDAQDKFEDAKHDTKNAFREAKDSTKDTLGSAADDAKHALRNAKDNTKDTLKDWERGAERNAEKAKNKLADATEDAREGLKQDGGAAHFYSIAGLAMLVLEMFKIVRPELATEKVFGFAMTKLGAELSVITGHLATVPYMMQMMAVLSLPALFAFLNQATQAKEGNLQSDSSMRINFGLAVSTTLSAVALYTSPLFTNMGGPAIIWASSVILLSALAVIKGTRATSSLGALFKKTFSGLGGTLKRALSVQTWEGSLYGIAFVLTGAAFVWTTFGNATVGDMFGTAIGQLVPAHREVVSIMSRAITAQLAFISVAFVALKELADKRALATPTARLLNFGLTAMFIGFGVLVRGGEANNMFSTVGIQSLGIASKIAAVLMVVCGAFMIYPDSKSDITEDTPEECYN